MFRIPRFRASVVPVAVLAAVLALACQGAQAQVRPFQIVGAGVAPEGIPLPPNSGPHWAVGEATGLGVEPAPTAVRTTETATDVDISFEIGG